MDFPKFIEEFNKLKLQYPVLPSHNFNYENSDYGDYLAYCQNAFYCFDTSYSKNIVYIFDSYKALDCVDGDYVVESENCYECVDAFKAYNCTYLNYCARIYNSHFCYHCNDSDNLFGCVYLNYKKYCIFNRQYSEEEYKIKIQELLKRPVEENLQEMKKLILRFPVTSTIVSNADNCEYGNHIHYSKNMYLCFDCARSENCAYLYDCHRNKHCYDMTQTFSSEFSSECVNSNKLNNSFKMDNCDHVIDSRFCLDCKNSNNLFGCVSLDKKEHCILNKQYSKEKYDTEIKEIMTSFKEINK